MGKSKTKVEHRQNTKRHKRGRRPGTSAGASGGGGLVTGLRSRVQSFAGAGRRAKGQGSQFWNMALWGLFALAVVLLIMRRGC